MANEKLSVLASGQVGSGSSALVNLASVGAANLGIGTDVIAAGRELEQMARQNPEGMAAIYATLWEMVRREHPEKAEAMRVAVAQTVGINPESSFNEVFDRVREFASDHKVMLAVITAIAAIIGAGLFWRWWSKRKQVGDQGADVMELAELQLRPLVTSALARYAGQRGGDGDENTVWGQAANAIDPATLVEAFQAIDFIRGFFGSVENSRRALIAFRGLELEHFDYYTQLRR